MRQVPTIVILGVAIGAACSHVPPVAPPTLFPMATAWTTPLPAVVEGPLAADATAIYVATRDGGLRSLALSTGAVRWEASGRPGTVAAGEGALVLHEEGGTVWSIDPATGATRWKVDSGVPGTLPAALYKDAVVVAGHGLSVLQAATGATRWSAPDVVATTLPLAWGPWLLTGEADGGLHCRDLATGAALWTYATPHPLLAPPVVDAEGRVLLGTTDRRFVSLDARGKGHERWRWKVGADVQAPPALSGPRVLFTTHEDVLYALRRGDGHLAWRAALPSRPLSGPLLYGDGVLVATFGARPGETFLIGFDLVTGRRQGDLKAPGEVRTPPVIAGDLVILGLRERAVAALRLGSVTPNP